MGNRNSIPCSEDQIEIKKDIEGGYNRWGYRPLNFKSLELMKPHLKVGDIIAVRSGFIDHYMVNIDQVHCIHFYAIEEDGKKKSDAKSVLNYLGEQAELWPRKWADQPGEIALETLESAIGPRSCRIDNRIDQALGFGVKTRRKGHKILEEAQKAWELPHPKYNIGNYNCETFALELRYGKRIPSEQCYPTWIPSPINTLINFIPIYGLMYLLEKENRNKETALSVFLCLQIVESVRRKIGFMSVRIPSEKSYYWTWFYILGNRIINFISVYAMCVFIDREWWDWAMPRYLLGSFYIFDFLVMVWRVVRDPNILFFTM